MFNTSVIEISKPALENNLLFLRGLYGSKVRISSVVKGNAYGHHIETFVPLAEECGIDHFSVFNAYEAFRVFKSIKQDSKVMIMGMIDNSELDWAVENGIEFYVFEFDRLNQAVEVAKRIGKKAIIHVEVETGMNRTGFPRKDYKKLIALLKENKEHLQFEGLCTHFAGAESIANYYRIQKQNRNYQHALAYFAKYELHPNVRHTACSAATIVYPRTRLDMVRIGIMQYGFWSSTETFINYISKQKNKIDPLIRVLRWKSRVMSVKKVKAGEFIGYGTNFITQQETMIATIPVGYSHGYSRDLSFQGRVLIRENVADVVGIVNMNLVIVDVTSISGVQKGDEVILIGKQGESEITVSSFSEISNQLNYELLTRLPAEIPRVVEVEIAG